MLEVDKHTDVIVSGRLQAGRISHDLPSEIHNTTRIDVLAVAMPRSEFNVHEGNRYIDFSVGDGTITGFRITDPGSGYFAFVPPQTNYIRPPFGSDLSQDLTRNMGIQIFGDDGPIPWQSLSVVKSRLNDTGGISSLTVTDAYWDTSVNPMKFSSPPIAVVSAPLGNDFVLSYELGSLTHTHNIGPLRHFFQLKDTSEQICSKLAGYIGSFMQGIEVTYEPSFDSLQFSCPTAFKIIAEQGSPLNLLDKQNQSSLKWETTPTVEAGHHYYRVLAFKPLVEEVIASVKGDRQALITPLTDSVITAALRPGLYSVGSVVHRPVPDTTKSTATSQRESKISRPQAISGLLKEIQDAMNIAYLNHTKPASWLEQKAYDYENIFSPEAWGSQLPPYPMHDGDGLGTAPPYPLRFLVSLSNDNPLTYGFNSMPLSSITSNKPNSSVFNRIRISTTEEIGPVGTTPRSDKVFRLLFASGPNCSQSLCTCMGFEPRDYVTTTMFFYRQLSVDSSAPVAQYFPCAGFQASGMPNLDLDPQVLSMEVSVNRTQEKKVFYVTTDGNAPRLAQTTDNSWYTEFGSTYRVTGNYDYHDWLGSIQSTGDFSGIDSMLDRQRQGLALRVPVRTDHRMSNRIQKGHDFGVKSIIMSNPQKLRSVQVNFRDLNHNPFTSGSGVVTIILRFLQDPTAHLQ